MEEKNNNIVENNNSKDEFIISPCKLTRRILAFLGDFFITFILSILLYEVAIMPLASITTSYNDKIKEIDSNQLKIMDTLYENDLLFYENEDSKYDYNTNSSYTCDKFVEYYTFKDEDNNKYQNINEFDVISTYYFKKYDNQQEAKKYIYNLFNNTSNDPNQIKFFKVSDSYDLVLKDEYKDEFKAYFDEYSSMSKQGEADLELFKSNIFNYNYANIITEFAKTNQTYINCNNQINMINNSFDDMYTVCAFISFFISCIVMYLVIPLIDKKSRTLTKMILKIEYFDLKTNYFINKRNVIFLFFLNMIENFSMLVFIPFISLGFSKIFSLTVLLIFSIVSFIYCLINLCIAAGNSYNKSIKELFFNMIVIDTKASDELLIYKEQHGSK